MKITLFGNIVLDVIGPLSAPPMIYFEIVAVILEAVIIYFLLVKEAVKAFVASFTANLVTGLLNIVYLIFFWIDVSTYPRNILVMAVPLLINILVEAGILRSFYKTMSTKKILKVSAIMNIASYALLIFFI
jgi:hypothetical protein